MDNSQQMHRTDRLAAASLVVFESKSPLKDVKLDPTNSLWMLDSEPSLSAPDLERRVLRMKLIDSGEQALRLMPRARELHVTHSQTWRHLGLMLYDAKHYPESFECFQKAFETTTDKDYQFMALAWQGLLLDLLGRREAAIEAYKAAQANGSEQMFRHDQYKLSIDQKWIEERLRIPFKRE
jgi:tetratricopeptide (TPR) repeat protein